MLNLAFLQDVVDKLQPLSLEFQNDELLVCHVPSKVKQTKSVIDALHNLPGLALIGMLSELNMNDKNELIYKDTGIEKQVERRAFKIEHSPGYKKH